MIWTYVIAAVVPVLTAVEGDIGTYRSAKANNPGLKFDWAIALVKYAKGAAWGVGGALGIGAVGESAVPDGAVAQMFWPW